MQANNVSKKNKGTILAKIILTMIIIGITVSPVMAYRTNWTPATPFPPGFNKSVMNPYDSTPVFNYSSLPPEERKIAPNLLEIIYPDRFSINLENAKKNLQNAELYRPGTVTIQDGVKIQATPDLVFLDIKLWPGNSTHILDPYINELNSRREEIPGIEAWIEVSNIENIARMPEVGSIRTVSPIYYNIGGHETEGNITLHTKEVIELPETLDGESIRVGAISDGVNHIADAIGLDDLPNVTIGNEGNGEEGTALLEIIHDLAPNASLFLRS